MNNCEKALASVITVGEGRGFVIEGPTEDRFVVTAAHCLPSFPACPGALYVEKRTYKRLLGPIGSKSLVWAECLFADPIADIAVLGPPRHEDLWERQTRTRHWSNRPLRY
jgi:hypothetical protein